MNKKSKTSQRDYKSPVLKALNQKVQQLRHAKELRIQAPEEISLDAVVSIPVDANPAHQAATPLAEAFTPDTLVRFLADLGTGLWRIKQRMVDSKTGRPLEEMRKPYRHLESVWDVLDRARIHIHDHTGESLPKGGFSSLQVVEYVPTPGLTAECVTETIKPTISIKGNGANPDFVIQTGEVIVGTPESTSSEHLAPALPEAF